MITVSSAPGRTPAEPPKEKKKRRPLYTVCKFIFSPLLHFCMNIRIRGKENLLPEKEGGVIVCCNHTSLFDVIVLGVAFDRQLRFMAKKELFSIPLLRGVIRRLGAFSVDRRGSDVDALKKAIALASDGEAVTIFPQGTRCVGEEVASTRFKSGAAMTAYHAHTRVQPVFIGVKGRKFRPFCRKNVVIGKPITWEELGFAEGQHPSYAEATAVIKERLCALDPIAPALPK